MPVTTTASVRRSLETTRTLLTHPLHDLRDTHVTASLAFSVTNGPCRHAIAPRSYTPVSLPLVESIKKSTCAHSKVAEAGSIYNLWSLTRTTPARMRTTEYTYLLCFVTERQPTGSFCCAASRVQSLSTGSGKRLPIQRWRKTKRSRKMKLIQARLCALDRYRYSARADLDLGVDYHVIPTWSIEQRYAVGSI